MLNIDDLSSLLNLAKTATIQAGAAQQIAALFGRAEAALNQMAFNVMQAENEARRPKTPPVAPPQKS